MANYYITGVWKDVNKVITHIYLHLVGNNGFQQGIKTTVAQGISLVEGNNSLTTLRWDYREAIWKLGEPVIVVHDGVKKYLRTKPDAQVQDNLDNMINMIAIVT